MATTHPPPSAEVKERVELPLLHLWAFMDGSILTFTLPLPLYFSNKEIYSIFKICCIISLLFPTQCCLYHDFIYFFCSNNTFFINRLLKFKYLTGRIRSDIWLLAFWWDLLHLSL